MFLANCEDNLLQVVLVVYDMKIEKGYVSFKKSGVDRKCLGFVCFEMSETIH